MEWKEFILSLVQWIETQGPEAVVWMILLQALFVILVIPGPFFTAGAGLMFGMWGGLAVAATGSTLGAAIAYLLGRLLLPYLTPGRRNSGDARPVRRPWVVALEHFVRGGGWKIVLSTRLIPLFPFKLSNYMFGWMRFPFRPFLVGTFVGIIPMTAVSVAAGSVASDVASLLKPGQNAVASRWPWSVAALLFALALGAWAGVQGRRKMKEMQARGDLGEAPESPTVPPDKDPNRERDVTEGSE